MNTIHILFQVLVQLILKDYNSQYQKQIWTYITLKLSLHTIYADYTIAGNIKYLSVSFNGLSPIRSDNYIASIHLVSAKLGRANLFRILIQALKLLL